MSTILKALRRIEDDKAPPPGARPLREEVAAVPGEPLARRRLGEGRALWLVGALALVLLGLAVMGGALWLPRGGGEREESSPARAAVPERTAPGPRSDAAGAAPPTGARLAAPPTPGRSSPSEATAAGAARPSDEPPTAMDVAVGSTEGRAASDVSGRSAEAPSAEARDAATPRRDPAPASRDSAATEPTRPSAPTARRSAPEPAPPAATADPEPAVRNIMPELTVAGTVWHPDPGQRTARVELAGRGEPLVLREGDAVGSLVVKAIEPSGVVFRMGEVEVRRRVGQ